MGEGVNPVGTPAVIVGQIGDTDGRAGAHGGQAGPVVMAVLDLVEGAGVGVAAGHGQRAAVAVHGDPAGQPAPDRVGGVAGKFVEEPGDVLGVEEQLAQLTESPGAVWGVVTHAVWHRPRPISERGPD
ncbi:MAG TPA: hypothetical protein VHY21_19850 [Pseudonocardiaceae bacterium]|jgi:hypothetical protein|nr:hypothetical protein [Pseudonocardiaceae bacterium]